MQSLQGVDQHTSNVFTGAQHVQAALIHVLEGVRFARWQRVAGARLHVFPPAVVGTTKPNQMAAPGVVAGQAHGLHHSLCTRHMKRHLVQPGNPSKPIHVVEHAGVVGAKHRPQFLHRLLAGLDAAFVEIVAQEVDAVGTGQVKKDIAVEVSHGHALRRLQKTAAFDVACQVIGVLVRHPIPPCELHVRNDAAGTRCHCDTFGIPRVIQGGQPGKAVTATLHHRAIGTVRVEEGVFVIGIARQQASDAFGDTRVTCERTVFGTRELKASFGFGQDPSQDAQGQ